jgi:hypothetical protein
LDFLFPRDGASSWHPTIIPFFPVRTGLFISIWREDSRFGCKANPGHLFFFDRFDLLAENP